MHDRPIDPDEDHAAGTNRDQVVAQEAPTAVGEDRGCDDDPESEQQSSYDVEQHVP